MYKYIALIQAKMPPVLTEFWRSAAFWRSVSLSLFLLIAIAYLFRDGIRKILLQEQSIKHDKENFNLLDLIMPEQKLVEMLDKLDKEKVFEISSLNYVDKFRDTLNGRTRRFVNRKINKACNICLESLNDLKDFLGQNFVEFPATESGQSSLMYPNPEIDGGGNEKEKDHERFEQFSKDLALFTSMARKNYLKYREAVKISLLV